MHKKRFGIHVSIATLLLLLAMSFAASADSVPRMSTDELNSHLGENAPLILDVRASRDWTGSTDKIIGAVRVDPGSVNQWAADFPKERAIVLYCAWGNEYTSASVARQLLEKGFTKVYALKGGWREWQSKEYPTEPK